MEKQNSCSRPQHSWDKALMMMIKNFLKIDKRRKDNFLNLINPSMWHFRVWSLQYVCTHGAFSPSYTRSEEIQPLDVIRIVIQRWIFSILAIKICICIIHIQISLIYYPTPSLLADLEGIGGIRVDAPIKGYGCMLIMRS